MYSSNGIFYMYVFKCSYVCKWAHLILPSICSVLDILGVMIAVVKMGTVIQVQTLDEAVCVSHSVNAIGEGMNTAILCPALGKL